MRRTKSKKPPQTSVVCHSNCRVTESFLNYPKYPTPRGPSCLDAFPVSLPIPRSVYATRRSPFSLSSRVDSPRGAIRVIKETHSLVGNGLLRAISSAVEHVVHVKQTANTRDRPFSFRSTQLGHTYAYLTGSACLDFLPCSRARLIGQAHSARTRTHRYVASGTCTVHVPFANTHLHVLLLDDRWSGRKIWVRAPARTRYTCVCTSPVIPFHTITNLHWPQHASPLLSYLYPPPRSSLGDVAWMRARASHTGSCSA